MDGYRKNTEYWRMKFEFARSSERTSDSEFHRFSSIDYDEIFRLTKKKNTWILKKKKKEMYAAIEV